MTMIERVARAIAPKAWKTHGLNWKDTSANQYRRRASLKHALVAIEAMREPTGKMKDAGAESFGLPDKWIGDLPPSVIDGQPSKVWRAMIDAALAEPQE